MNINVMLSVTLSDECKDYRDDMNEALKNEGWEKIDIVNTVWFRVFSFDDDDDVKENEKTALKSAKKSIKKAFKVADVECCVNAVIHAGTNDLQEHPHEIRVV